MKRNSLAILFAANLMLLACNNTPNNSTDSVESENIDNTEESVEMSQTQMEDFDPDEEFECPENLYNINPIKKEWEGKTIKVERGNSAIGIKQLALAFCKTYPKCATNKAIMDFLLSPDANKESCDITSVSDENSLQYHIECSTRNGHIYSMMMVETGPVTDACYWNRKNGHKLFAAHMEATHENGKCGEEFVVFYDYDPTTDIMTPEPAITNMIEERAKSKDSYSVSLPKEGTDIEVSLYTIDKENDSANSEDLTLKWNGTSFDWK